MSLQYPNLNADGASSVYYASLTSSVHRLNGTKKRPMHLDQESSIADFSSVADFPQEPEDPEVI